MKASKVTEPYYPYLILSTNGEKVDLWRLGIIVQTALVIYVKKTVSLTTSSTAQGCRKH
ncbi:hypothetical protein QZJ86_11275 [Methylomonas montana]|nr:hypothetical protein [Methylomonas montana]WKJ88607.1 hypothetical protein QZJ86_11275 [Methylomonas montana]